MTHLFCSCQTVKTKEEKEVLEYFAGVVSRIPAGTHNCIAVLFFLPVHYVEHFDVSRGFH